MDALIFCIVLLGILFALSYFVKRRFGVLGLALAAGSLISLNYATVLADFLQLRGIVIVAPPLLVIVQALLVLLPPLILIFSGPSYKDHPARIIGSAMFAVLAFAFLLPALTLGLRLDDTSTAVFEQLQALQPTIIVIGLAAAVGDVLLTHSPKKFDGKKDGKH